MLWCKHAWSIRFESAFEVSDLLVFESVFEFKVYTLSVSLNTDMDINSCPSSCQCPLDSAVMSYKKITWHRVPVYSHLHLHMNACIEGSTMHFPPFMQLDFLHWYIFLLVWSRSQPPVNSIPGFVISFVKRFCLLWRRTLIFTSF